MSSPVQNSNSYHQIAEASMTRPKHDKFVHTEEVNPFALIWYLRELKLVGDGVGAAITFRPGLPWLRFLKKEHCQVCSLEKLENTTAVLHKYWPRRESLPEKNMLPVRCQTAPSLLAGLSVYLRHQIS